MFNKTFATRFRHLKRFRQILAILIKYGFENVLHDMRLDAYIHSARKVIMGADHGEWVSFSRWQRIRMALEDLGPNFIKIGQILSNRPDLLPADLIIELSKLQDSSAPFPGHEARAIIAEELGQPVETLFREFNDVPIASASVAQVHRAVLHDGTVVAVKVQRPDIRKVINTDIEILINLAELLEKFVKGMGILNPVNIMEEYSKAINMELDFTREAFNINRFKKNFKEDDTIYIPLVYQDLTTSRVLTMEFVEGDRLTDFIQNQQEAVLKAMAKRIMRLMIKQIFEHGYFHADPHPGNLFILKDHQVCFLDYGLMGTLTVHQREQVNEMLIGIANRDSAKIVAVLQRMTEGGYIEDKSSLEHRVKTLLQKYAGKTLGEIDLSNLFYDVIKTIMSFRLKILPDFFLLIKSIITMKSVINRLDPDYNIDEHLIPILQDIFYNHHGNPRRIAENFYASAFGFMNLIHSAPEDLKELSEQLKRGKLTLSLNYKGFDSAQREFEKSSNRIVISILAAALLIASSLIVAALIMTSKTTAVDFHGINIGFGELIFAAGLVIFLFISMIIKKR